MKPIITKDTSEKYHANKEFIGSSSLRKYKDSPLHFIAEPLQKTDALDFGTIYHTFMLEPDLFKKSYFVLDPNQRPEPLKTFGSTANKKWKAEIEEKYPFIVSFDQIRELEQMKKQLFKNFYIQYLFKTGEAELSHYTEFQGVKVKVRPDWKSDKYLIDLKTTKNASKKGFIKSATEYEYYTQAAFYLDVIESIDQKSRQFLFIAQEKHYPYAVNIFRASAQFLAIGRYEYEILLEQHEYCLENGIYEGYSVFADNIYGITEIDVPPYKIEELKFYNEKK